MNISVKILLLVGFLSLTACGGGSESPPDNCTTNCSDGTPTPKPEPEPAPKNSDPAADANGNVMINGVKHPGIMSTTAQLTKLQQRYQNGDVKTTALVQDLIDYANQGGLRIRNPGAENPATGGGALIYCGGYNKGRDGVTKIYAFDWPAENGITAYTFALLSVITQDKSYASTALAYLMSWANEDNFKGFDTEGLNAPLQHGWILPWFTNAAEILRYSYSEWTDNHSKKINQLVHRLLPLVTSDAIGAPQNWLHSRIEGHIAAAIWLSDAEMLTTAFNRWKAASRTYIYIDADNGSPLPSINHQYRGTLEEYWDTPKFVAGLTMETCRDLDHQSLGMKSIFNSLMMANSQGVDLLTGNDNKERLITFLQVQPNWTQSKSEHPDGICNNPVIIKGNGTSGIKLSEHTVRYPYVLGYSLLKSNQAPLNLLKNDIEQSPTVTASRWVTKWETLLASAIE